ncbi:hypothetical protein Nizo2494_0554 [Lactiplantibacillus plantarum]|uniref:Uncharacterized protein n=2 Tax=Lactiplantibacillus plantarum TaxID=1590 RepID=A0AAW3RE67_LACPN|nr:hypothetical protein [Lactiplantibacillus plantarum]ADN98363.1 hypothetical protein LPST_C1144 [Lactiplantibacillus plantarum ST-III]ERO42122.1 hypothetical protein LPLWJ_06960 [Lactiplantibacillus plantarum WJL]ETF10553.1 hypothetical protein N654_3010 [Lactiplantibacillus plantarum 4_3]KPN41348.1 hypothetical protein WJL_2716 [Lactiplantibacillus plantarum WJL]KZD92161.1 hypothetical protein FBR5_2714 [Lactiplantibacillus plantarum]
MLTFISQLAIVATTHIIKLGPIVGWVILVVLGCGYLALIMRYKRPY